MRIALVVVEATLSIRPEHDGKGLEWGAGFPRPEFLEFLEVAEV